jgi:hypothetical protein
MKLLMLRLLPTLTASRMLTPSAILAKFRSEMLDPTATNCSMDTALPNLEKERNERLLPILTKFMTLRRRHDPAAANPITLKLLPARMKDRREIALPPAMKLTHEIADPILEMLRIDNELPTVKNDKTDAAEPNLVKLRMLTLDPR